MENKNDDNTEIIIDIESIEEESNDKEWIDEEWTDEDYSHYKCMERSTLCFIVGLFIGVILFIFIKTALL